MQKKLLLYMVYKNFGKKTQSALAFFVYNMTNKKTTKNLVRNNINRSTFSDL